MKLPELEEIKSSTAVINEFRGINDNVFIGNEYVRNEKNMTSDFYPAMGSRKEREVIDINSELRELIEVNGQTVYANNNVLKIMDKSGTVIRSYAYDIDKIYRYGAFLICMPEKKMVNTAYDMSDPESKETVDLETILEFKNNTIKANMYVSDKEGIPYVVLPEEADNSFIGTQPAEGHEVEGIKSHDLAISAFAGGAGTYGTYNFHKTNVITPKFLVKRVIAYPDNTEQTAMNPINLVYGSQTIARNWKEASNYEVAYGTLVDNKPVFQRWNSGNSTWNNITVYITIWIRNTNIKNKIKENIKAGDYVKLDLKKLVNGQEQDYTKDNSLDDTFKFIDTFKNYVKVEKVLVSEATQSEEADVGLVFAGNNILNVLEEKNKVVRGSDNSSIYGKMHGTIYNMTTVIGCPNSATEGNDNICTLLRIKKDMPDMDYLTVANNRLWGCSNNKSEIYASKLGDPSNWHTYAGIASDSYAMTIGSNGDFTGACTYRGRPYFFKEDLIINIYGDKPSNYQLNEIFENGLEANSPKSLAEINGLLYYKSRQGICRFNGNNTVIISEQLGQTKYYNAVAGASDSKYFVSMKKINENNKYIYVYDTKTDTWHIEDDIAIDYFYKIKDSLYAVKKGTTSKMYRLCGTTSMPDTMNTLLKEDLSPVVGKECTDYETLDFTFKNHGVEFFAETGDIDAGVENKYIQKLGIRFEIEKDAYIRIKIKYDNDRQWTDAFNHTGKKDMDAVNVTLRPHRCKRFKLRVEGQGFVKIHEIKRILNKGSDFK